MSIESIYRCVAALDVHQSKLTVCVQVESESGEITNHLREFGGFKRNRREMAEWIHSFHPECVVMESTGIYWKSPYSALEKVGIQAVVVNARHVKTVPGRKTDIGDAQWLATLARSGLLKGSFVPPAHFRELRLISRHRQKVTSQLSSEKNRLHKVLTDSGVRLSVVVSDIHGKAAREMIHDLIEGQSPERILSRVNTNRLKADNEEIQDALEGELTDTHRFVLSLQMKHIEYLETQIAELDDKLLAELAPQEPVLHLLQTIPGVDLMGAAMMLVEISDDMAAFGSAEKLASWAGVCPGNHESAGKRVAGKKRKGNPYLRRLLCESAHAASRTKSALQLKYESLIIRKGRKRAIFALAHKILKIIYILISRGQCYRDATVNYEEMSVKRNAPRWIRMLQKYGFISMTMPA